MILTNYRKKIATTTNLISPGTCAGQNFIAKLIVP